MYRQYQTVQFYYGIMTGQTSYLLSCKEADFSQYTSCLDDMGRISSNLHPFSVHLAVLFQSIVRRSEHTERSLNDLLQLEYEQLYSGEDQATPDIANDTKIKLKALHSLFLNFSVRQNNNRHDLAIVELLIRDLKRLDILVGSIDGSFPIDPHSRDRVHDGLLFLQELCQERATRLAIRKERTQNLINFVGDKNKSGWTGLLKYAPFPRC